MTRKTYFFEGSFWFKFNNLKLVLNMAFTFYTNVTKGLKLKVGKFLGLNPKFAEVTGSLLNSLAECLKGSTTCFLKQILWWVLVEGLCKISKFWFDNQYLEKDVFQYLKGSASCYKTNTWLNLPSKKISANLVCNKHSTVTGI